MTREVRRDALRYRRAHDATRGCFASIQKAYKTGLDPFRYLSAYKCADCGEWHWRHGAP